MPSLVLSLVEWPKGLPVITSHCEVPITIGAVAISLSIVM